MASGSTRPAPPRHAYATLPVGADGAGAPYTAVAAPPAGAADITKRPVLLTVTVLFVAAIVAMAGTAFLMGVGAIRAPPTEATDMRKLTCAAGPSAARWLVDCDGMHAQYEVSKNGTRAVRRPISATTDDGGATAVYVTADEFRVQTRAPGEADGFEHLLPTVGQRAAPGRRRLRSHTGGAAARASALAATAAAHFRPTAAHAPPPPLEPLSFYAHSGYNNNTALLINAATAGLMRPLRVDVPAEADDACVLALARAAAPTSTAQFLLEPGVFRVGASAGTASIFQGDTQVQLRASGQTIVRSDTSVIQFEAWGDRINMLNHGGVFAMEVDGTQPSKFCLQDADACIERGSVDNTVRINAPAQVEVHGSGMLVQNSVGGDSRACFLDNTACIGRPAGSNSLELHAPVDLDVYGSKMVIQNTAGGDSQACFVDGSACVARSAGSNDLELRSAEGVVVHGSGMLVQNTAGGDSRACFLDNTACISRPAGSNDLQLHAPVRLVFLGQQRHEWNFLVYNHPDGAAEDHYFQTENNFIESPADSIMVTTTREYNPQCTNSANQWMEFYTASSAPVGAPPSTCTRVLTHHADLYQFFDGSWNPEPASTAPPGPLGMNGTYTGHAASSAGVIMSMAGGGAAGAGSTVNMTASLLVTEPVRAAAFDSPSDSRLKTGVVGLTAAESTARVMGLRPVEYQYTPPYRAHAHSVHERVRGFIAQEVQAVCPECVAAGPAFMPGDPTEYMRLDKLRMLADVVATLQSVVHRLEALEAAAA